MIGLIEDVAHITTQNFKNVGHTIILLGENKEELGASEYLHTIFGQTGGEVPQLEIHFEKRLQESLLSAIRKGQIVSAHDCSEGGLAVALVECCISEREHMIGASITLQDKISADALLFGESQSRIIISCEPDQAASLINHFMKNNIPCVAIGRTGGERFSINGLIDVELSDLADAFYNALPHLMERVA
jgi:phosphoribosylformylglycinamidine synthase